MMMRDDVVYAIKRVEFDDGGLFVSRLMKTCY